MNFKSAIPSINQKYRHYAEHLIRDRAILVLPVSLLHKKSSGVYLRTKNLLILIRYNLKLKGIKLRGAKAVLRYIHVVKRYDYT